MKKVYALETVAETAIETAIGTLLEAPYLSPGDDTLWPKVVTRTDAKKVLIRRAISKNRRGRTGGSI